MIKTVFKTMVSLLTWMFVSGFIVFILIFFLYNGLFRSWEPLDNPAQGDRVTKIVALGRVQTESGAIYSLDKYTFEWKKGEPSGSEDYNFDLRNAPSQACQTFSFLPIKRASFVDYKKSCIYYVFGYATLANAIDKDGNLYIWINPQGGEFSGIEVIIFPIFISLIGLILGIVSIVIKVFRHHRQSI